LLYHEATFTEKHSDRAKETQHSTALQAANVAKAAGVKNLILGHFSARYKNPSELVEEAATVFDKVSAVEDGMRFVM
jgi:ribonuclease Z